MRTLISLVFCLLLLAALPAVPQAQTVPAQNRALVVLRFNQPHVYYEEPLYNAISQAVARKSSVMFDVVSYAPATGDADADGQWQVVASHNTQLVVASMQRMGIPMSRMRVSGQRQAGLSFDEVRIFVR